ncbi:MAG: transporter substrate-binding domain-containing protein [Thalassotalea sp.]|nr:transporter substrate-binding domain-containing protein [Thalassotalea sp.]
MTSNRVPNAVAVPLLFLAYWILNSIAHGQATLKICHEAYHNPPYFYLDKGKPSGILLGIVKEAALSANINVELYGSSWIRCQNDVKSGRAQALFPMIASDERRADFAFPPKTAETDWHMWLAQYPVFIAVNDEFDVDNYQPQQGIGAPIGYVVWHKLSKKEWLSPLQYDPVEGFSMLALNKLDGYVVEQQIGLQLIKEYQLANKVKKSNYSFLDTPWYIAFNNDYYRTDAEAVLRFWQKISEVRTHYQ